MSPCQHSVNWHDLFTVQKAFVNEEHFRLLRFPLGPFCVKKTKSCITVFTCRLWFAYIALLQGTNHKMKAQVCFTALSPSHSSVEGAIQFPCFVLGGYNNVNAISISAAIKSTLIYRLIGVSRRAPQTMGIWGTLNLGGKGIAMVARGVTLLSLGSARRL